MNVRFNGKGLLIFILMLILLFILPRLFMFGSPYITFGITAIIMVMIVLGSVLLNTKANKKANISLANIPTEFENIYQDLYIKNISNLEHMRKQARWRTIIQYVALVLFLIGGFTRPKIVFLAFIVFFVLVLVNSKYISKYKEMYKEEVIQKFIKLVNNKLEYKRVSEELLSMEDDYKKASFDNKVFNRFYPDDYIQGFLDDEIFAKMSDLHIQHHVRSGKNSHTYEVFQGVFVQTDCNKNIGTYIKISKNQLKIFEQHDRVEMDSQEFEKYFDIYSENKILTMQILTSDVMTTLVDFYNKYNIDYEIVIKNNRIYMRFFTGAMFEPKIFGNSMDKKLLFSYFCILKFIADVTKEVNKALKEVEI